MADTITIPSPSVFLTRTPIASPSTPPSIEPAPPAKPKQTRKRNPAAAKAKAAADKSGDTALNGVDKKKQTKSRYGRSFPSARVKAPYSKHNIQDV